MQEGERKMNKLIGKVVRYGFTAIGAVLVSRGAITEDQANAFVSTNTEIVVGVVTMLAGPLYSILVKKI